MIARPEISRNERKTAERGAFEVGNFARFSRPGKNAQYRAHGPGLPCAFAVRAKFVAIGTSRGLTLVFDHFQEVRRVLGTASDDGVTSVDLSVSGDLVACGHASGKVALWDVIKGANLKTLDDAHGAPVAALRFYRDDQGRKRERNSQLQRLLSRPFSTRFG
jgi:WD40 repeat protein